MEYIFDDVLEIKNGKNQKAVENSEGQYPIYGSGGVMGYAEDYICDANTVIIGRKGSINNPIYVSEPFWNVDTAFGLSAKRELLLPRYLFYFCKKFDFRKLNKTVTIPSLTKSDLLKIRIDLPVIAEQQEVVDKLSKIEAVIDLRKQELTALDDLIKARFVEMFVGKDYPLIVLDDLSLGKGEYGAQSASIDYNPSRPRYVRITDINDDGTLNDDIVSSANVEDDKQYKLNYGDFMFARMGATVGKTYAYKSGNQIFAGYLIRYKLNIEKIMPEYLYAYTKLDEYRNWVLLNQSGAAQPGINAKKYGSLQIPVAPLEEQKAFVKFINQVDKSKVAVQKALDETQLLFNSLMQKYFG